MLGQAKVELGKQGAVATSGRMLDFSQLLRTAPLKMPPSPQLAGDQPLDRHRVVGTQGCSVRGCPQSLPSSQGLSFPTALRLLPCLSARVVSRSGPAP